MNVPVPPIDQGLGIAQQLFDMFKPILYAFCTGLGAFVLLAVWFSRDWLMNKFLRGKTEKGNGEHYRRKQDLDNQRIADAVERATQAIEKLNVLLHEINHTHSLMAAIMDRQENNLQTGIDRQRKMAFELEQVHKKVMGA